MMKVYISAPIAGYEKGERKEFFSKKADMIRKMGFEPINPMNKIDVDYNDSREIHLRADTRLLLNCDEIWFFGYWYKSDGCLYEMEVARNCGIEIKFVE